MSEPRITSSTLACIIEVGARIATFAKRLAVVAMAKLAAPPATSPEKCLRDPLVVDVFDMYVAARADAGTHAPGTFEGYRTARGHIAQSFANVRASQLDPERIEDAQRLLRGHLRPSTVRNVLAHAASAWRWAARNARKTGVTTRWERPEPGSDLLGSRSTRKRPYTVREIELMLARAARHGEGWHLPLRVLAETGARVGEVCQLRGRDLERDERGRTFALVGASKRRLPRRIPLLPETARLLAGKAADEPLFVNDRGRRLTPDTLRKRVRQLLDEVGLGEAEVRRPGCRQQVRLLDVHGFRRSFITHCARAGVPKSLCMTMVGHAFQGVHESYERNATGDDLHAMVQRMFDWRRSTLTARACG